MELIVAIPAIWGNCFCVVLPAPPSGDQSKWNEANFAWIKKLVELSPENPEIPDEIA